MLDGKVSGETLVNPLGRLEDRVQVRTVFGRQEGVHDVLRDVVRDEVEDVRRVRLHHLRFAVGGLKKRGLWVSIFMRILVPTEDMVPKDVSFLVSERDQLRLCASLHIPPLLA